MDNNNTGLLDGATQSGELVSIDHRLQNVERIASTVESVANKGLESWTHYLEQKNEQEKREIEAQDAQHKRASILLGASIIFVFILLLVSIFKEQYELVKIILGSSLALAAGAGLSNVFRGKK